VGSHGTVVETGSLQELRSTLHTFLRGGTRYLVSHGGDGALNWILNEARALPRDAGAPLVLPPLVPTNAGTIDFVAKKVGIEGRAEQVVRTLVQALEAGRPPEVTALESLELSGEQRLPDGRLVPFHRVGFASAIGGVGQRFFDKYYQAPDPGAGTIVRIVALTIGSQAAGLIPWARARRLDRYAEAFFAPTRARVTIDGEPVPVTEHRALHAGSFDVNLGGVFRVFPLARAPGILHLQAGNLGPWDIVRQVPNLYRGEPIDTEGLWERAGREMTVEALGDELLNPVIDGEVFRHLTHVTVRPGPIVSIARV
jgi:diacylglycerol kinase family enzyme